MGLKSTIRHCLFAGCALLLLAPACATSSKTEKASPAPASQKGFPSKPAAKSSNDGKKNAKAADSAKAAAAEAKKPPPPPPEPDLPSRLPRPLHCPIPSEVPADTEFTIRCAVRPALATRSVVVSYRPSGSENFATTDAIRSPKGWYVISLKPFEVRGSSLQFYVQAYNGNNRMVASSGSDESPNIVLIRKGSSGAPGGAELPVAEEDPLARIQRERDVESGLSHEVHRTPAGRVWLAMGMGSGYGWFPTRSQDVYVNAKSTGWATGGILHLLPEVGYQWRDHIAFSLQGRLQFVYTKTGAGNLQGEAPKGFAWAVLGRGYLFTDRLFGPASNFQLFATGTLGAGTAFRLYVAPSPNQINSSANFVNSDTVSGGPIAVGVGGGVAYHFSNALALAAELRALAGVWNFATVIEAGASLQWAFWSPGEHRAAEAAPEIAPEPEFTPPD
ncbi:MAG: hypothetical protein WCG85_25005 [Polyangia bacterium]